jgi:NAD(P)-dependent dehydrogenase (short-subunit alcohol dehydrogenase family)
MTDGPSDAADLLGPGRVAVVTGAAQGLGAAFARALAARGGTVVTCDVLPGCDAVVDVADAAAVKEWIDGVASEHRRIDVAVANAGIALRSHPLGDWDEGLAVFRATIGANLAGVFHLGRAVAPVMAAHGAGHIVVISTDHLVPEPGTPTGGGSRMDAYDASKWALRGLVESWALALGPSGIRVNAIGMGATDTPMIRAFFGAAPPAEVTDRWMHPGDVAAVLVALVDEGQGGRTGAHVPLWAGHPTVLPPG